MPTLVGIKRGDTNQSMHTGLRLEISIRERTGHRDRLPFDARFVSSLQIQCLHLELLTFRPSEVHAQQHLSPVLGFRSSGPRMDGKDGIVLIQFSRQQMFYAERSQQWLKLIELR